MSAQPTQAQIDELRGAASELTTIADAFRVTQSDGDVIRIPRRLCARMCEVLQATAEALLKIVETP